MASIKYSAELDTSKLDKSIKDSNKTIGDYAKNMEKAGGEMDKAFDKSTKNLKESIREQKELIKSIERDIKDLQKAFDDSIAGTAKLAVWKDLKAAKQALAEEQARLSDLQREQDESQYPKIINSVKKWAAGLVTLTAVIKTTKAIIQSTETTILKFESAVAQAKAGVGYFFKAIASGDWSNFLKNLEAAIKGAKDYTEAIASLTNKQNEQKIKSSELDKKIGALRDETYDRNAENYENRKNALEEIIKLEREKYTQEAELAKKAYEINLKKAATDSGLSEKQIEHFITEYSSLEELIDKGEEYNKLTKLMWGPGVNNEYLESLEKARKALGENAKEAGLYAKQVSKIVPKDREALSEYLAAANTAEAAFASKNRRDKMQLAEVTNAIIKEEENRAKAITEEEEKLAAKLKEIRNEVIAGYLEGKDKELFLLEQKYKEDLELYKDSEAIKLSLTEKYAQDRYTIEMKYLDKVKAENAKMTAALLKIDPGKGFSMLNRTLGDKAIDVSGMKGLAKGSAAWADKMSEEITENTNESLKRQIELRRQITVEAANLVYQIGETLGLDDESLEKLDGLLLTITRASSGDIPGAVSSLLTTILSQIDVTDKFADKVERLNKLIDRQNDLIRESERLGGTEGEMRKRISLLNEQLALLQEELKKAEKSQEGWFNWFAASNKEVQNLKDNIQDVQDAIDDATQELEDYMGGWVTENTIAEAIAEGFASGKTSVDDFAEYMNEVLRDAILNKFMSEMLGPAMTELQEYISLSLSDNVLTAEEKAEIDQRVKAIADSNKELWDDLSGALNMGESPTTGMMGIARQLTEETGAELAGLWRRSADDQRQMRDYTKEGVTHLVAIEHNTYNTVEELRVAVNELRDINSNTKPVYSGDM
jgi:hypothetical protein